MEQRSYPLRTKTDRHNRVKLQQLKRRANKAHDDNNWALYGELETKIAIVSRRLGLNYY